MMIALYTYFISSSVVSVVLRKELDVSIQETRGRVSTLETRYFARKEEITPALAHSLGFSDVSDRTFVERQSLSIRPRTVTE